MKKANDQTLKDALKHFVNAYKLKPRLHEVKVVELWTKIMGPTIKGYTREVSLRGKILYIGINSAALRQELAYGKEKIRSMMNEELGEECISEVVIR